MTVAYDENGYSYDVNTGYYVTLYWDEYSNAYDSETGERIDEVIIDSGGRSLYMGGGGGIDWNQVIYMAAQAYAAGQGAAQSGRYIPNPNQPPYGYQTLNQPPARPPTSGAGVGVGVTPGGVSGGINLSMTTLMLIAGGVLLFMLGSKKGR